jgi:hypothetical protein
MTDTQPDGPVDTRVSPGSLLARVDALAAEVESCLSCYWSSASDDEVEQTIRRVEVLRRRLDSVVDVNAVAELDARSIPGKHLARSTAAFLGGILRLSPGEAARRVKHARALGPRVTVTGQRLEPQLPIASPARLAGELSAEQVVVIAKTMQRLPDTLPVESHAWAEQTLVQQARELDAANLRHAARRILDGLDPDGRLSDEQDRRRRRFLSIRAMDDGMYRLHGDLDPETGLLAQTVLHSLTAPQPAQTSNTHADNTHAEHTGSNTLAENTSDEDRGPGRTGAGAGNTGSDAHKAAEDADPAELARITRDPRSPGQRLHDALRAMCKKLLRAGDLPATGGLPATILITMTAEQYETAKGVGPASVTRSPSRTPSKPPARPSSAGSCRNKTAKFCTTAKPNGSPPPTKPEPSSPETKDAHSRTGTTLNYPWSSTLTQGPGRSCQRWRNLTVPRPDSTVEPRFCVVHPRRPARCVSARTSRPSCRRRP